MTDESFYLERIDRNLGIISREEQEKLRQQKVAVIGNGGMGGWVAMALARIGVGHVVIADNEVFDRSNLNRQMGATIANLGRSKAICTYEMLREVVGDEVQIDVYTDGITEDNHIEMLCDCTFGFDLVEAFQVPARIFTHIGARINNVPLINCNVVGFGTRLFYFEPDGMSAEEWLGMDEREPMPLSNRSKMRLLERIVPQFPKDISEQIVRDWILDQGKAPIFGATSLISSGIAVDQFTLRVIGAERRPWVELVPPMPAYGWFDVALGMRGGIVTGKWWP